MSEELLPKELLVSVYEQLLEDENTKLALKVRVGELNVSKLEEIKAYLEKNYPE